MMVINNNIKKESYSIQQLINTKTHSSSQNQTRQIVQSQALSQSKNTDIYSNESIDKKMDQITQSAQPLNRQKSQGIDELQTREQFFYFIKELLQLLYQPKNSAHFMPIYSCLKNPYQKKREWQQIPNQTIAFLKKQRKGISQSKMTQISYFIGSKIDIFDSKDSMDHFLTETIRIKSFFIILLNWMIKSYPITIKQNTPSQDNFIQWVGYPNSQSKKTIVNKRDYLNQKLENVISFWDEIIKNQVVQQQLDRFSLMLNHPNFGQNSEEQKKYLSKLYQRIFIKEEIFGWNQLFNLKPIFQSLVKFRLQKHNQSDVPKPQDQQQFNNRIRQKTRILKIAFIYLHKYLLVKDFLHFNIKQAQKQKQYAKGLLFQLYLPKKIGLCLQLTLDYAEWFQVFYLQHNDRRLGIFKAAYNLFYFLNQEAGRILQTVKNFQRSHLSKLMYILTEKIESQKKESSLNSELANKLLKRQIQNFVQSNRVYEYLIAQLKYIVEQQFKRRKNSMDLVKLENLIVETLKKTCCSDILPLLIAYLKINTNRIESGTKIFCETMKKLNKNQKIKEKMMIGNLNKIKGQAQINYEFINSLNNFEHFQT